MKRRVEAPRGPEGPPYNGSVGVHRARVFVLYTGGTIGMVREDASSPLRPGDKSEILKYMPGLGERYGIHWEMEGMEGEQPLDSSDVNARHWIKMAQAIRDRYEEWDGFVILHGTDTMAYTASGLSFLFENLGKPVIITGAQLPISDERTDARLNLANALHIAGYPATHLPRIPEVALCFGESLLRGNRARKESTMDLNAFVSPNYPRLGRLGERIEIHTALLRPRPEGRFGIQTRLETRVMDFALFPGLSREPLAALLLNENVKGAVMRTFGAGNAMSDPGIHEVLREAIGQGKILLSVSQCQKGGVDMGLYAAGAALLRMGVVNGGDMTPEAALAKMFAVLGSGAGREEAVRRLQGDQRGEMEDGAGE